MSVDPLHTQHQRQFADRRFVYPVLSRRSGGISIGINLNPDKICNFGCIYCQVDRVDQAETKFVDLPQLQTELQATLRQVVSGELWTTAKFRHTPATVRRLADVAFSGDGEPTSHRNFDQVVECCLEVVKSDGPADLPVVLITNASLLHRPHVQRGLRLLDAAAGQIWAKLDAGTPEYFQAVCRTPFSLQHILANLLTAARQRPLVIQSLFLKTRGRPPSGEEIAAYCRRLCHLLDEGGMIRLVQIYTVARPTEESWATALDHAQVDAIVDRVRQATGLPVAGFYGV